MSSLKPIKLYSHAGGPNPWKINIICDELGIPYETEWMDFSVMKQKPFIDITPNGRVPAIEDPNTGITIWESGAIIKYLVSEYDKTSKISYTSTPEKYLTDQWLFFQMSGQGPYFGQFAWFSRFHPEKIPSAIERYKKEIIRVVGVIDLHLQQTGKQYLVGDKCTYADLSFVPWGNAVAPAGIDLFEGGTNQLYKAWWERVTGRESVKKQIADKAKAMESH